MRKRLCWKLAGRWPRGHTVEFATLNGQEHWVDSRDYEFITRVHALGPGPTDEQMEAHYRRSQQWDVSKGLGPSMPSKYLFDSLWPQTYHGLKGIMDDPATRPSLMVADFFVDAVKDVHVEYRFPIAVVWSIPSLGWRLRVICLPHVLWLGRS